MSIELEQIYVGVDASLASLAYAVINELGEIKHLSHVKLPKTGNKGVNRLHDHMDAVWKDHDLLLKSLAEAAIRMKLPVRVAIETTVAYSGPTASALGPGAFCSGYWTGLLTAMGCDVKPIAPSSWKGNKKKEKTVEKVNKVLGEDKIQRAIKKHKIPASRVPDVYDALGLALWRHENG